MRRLSELASSNHPTQVELFRLAHAHEVLSGYSDEVNAQWPELLARRFHALNLHFDRCVSKFEKWRAFLAGPAKDTLTSEQIGEVPKLASAVVEDLRNADTQSFIDPEVAAALELLQAPLNRSAEDESIDLIEAGKALLAADVLESVNNIFKRIVEGALVAKQATIPISNWAAETTKDAAKEYGKKAHNSIKKEAGRLGDKTGPAITKWTNRVFWGGTAATGAHIVLSRLLEAFPSTFHWLEAIKPFL